jgi:hypothetical protein
MASCATTQVKENPVESDDSLEQVQEEEEEEEITSLIEIVGDSSHGQEGEGRKAAVQVNPSVPASDAYHTDYLEFGSEKIPFVVSVPNNTDQEINAIIWFCDETVLQSSHVFDLGTYPSKYKEKYIIAVLPYKFKSGDVRVKNFRNSVGDVVEFVKVIADDHEIKLSRIILVGYAAGRFSMAYL